MKSPNPADPQQRRQRAFTLFVRAYEECRRAATYLRWHEDDADDIAPSLWTKRNRRTAAAPDAMPDTERPTGDTAPPEAPTPADR